jgi:hypothetical protein
MDYYLYLYKRIESASTRLDLQRAEALLRSGRCEHVYLDVGTNLGIQIRKLYEPKYFPGADVLATYNETFGSPEERMKVCTFGFEPNPHWTQKLKRLERAYRGIGVNILIFTETAAATHSNNLTFYLEPYEKPENHEWGASTIKWNNKGMVPVNVGAIELAQFLNMVRFRRGQTPRSKVVMKLDIEGAEFQVIPELVVQGSFCAVDYAICEFHHRFFEEKKAPHIPTILRNLNWIYAHTNGTRCPTVMTNIHDESYWKDGDANPLPEPTVSVVEDYLKMAEDVDTIARPRLRKANAGGDAGEYGVGARRRGAKKKPSWL